jgi:hypothetical protein
MTDDWVVQASSKQRGIRQGGIGRSGQLAAAARSRPQRFAPLAVSRCKQVSSLQSLFPVLGSVVLRPVPSPEPQILAHENGSP